MSMEPAPSLNRSIGLDIIELPQVAAKVVGATLDSRPEVGDVADDVGKDEGGDCGHSRNTLPVVAMRSVAATPSTPLLFIRSSLGDPELTATLEHRVAERLP